MAERWSSDPQYSHGFIVPVFALVVLCFLFNDTATTESYTLSLHDALPISTDAGHDHGPRPPSDHRLGSGTGNRRRWRSEEHTSELQSHSDLVCRLLLE